MPFDRAYPVMVNVQHTPSQSAEKLRCSAVAACPCRCQPKCFAKALPGYMVTTPESCDDAFLAQAKLFICRFLDAAGSGYTSDAANCLDWCRTNAAVHFTSNSYGGGGATSTMRTAIEVWLPFTNTSDCTHDVCQVPPQ
jgi:hypothetical protein